MADPRVIAFGKDLYALGLVLLLPKIKEKKTFRRDLLISNNYNLDVDNTDNLFSIDNSVSILNGIKWLYEELTIYGTSGEIIWEGIITDITRDHKNKTSVIETKSKLYQLRKRKIAYTSSDWETQATAFRNLCIQEGFTAYNSQSVTRSESLLTENNCFVKVAFDLEDNINFMEAIAKLGDYSNSDVYSHGFEVYFQHWVPFTGGVSVFLNTETREIGKRLKTVPFVRMDQGIMINDFSIGYDGDNEIPATDLNSDNIGLISRNRYGSISLPEMQSNENAQIIFKDKVSAVYIGNGNIKRTHKNLTTDPTALTKIVFNLFADHKDWITLETFLKLTFPDESWTEKVFEIFEFNVDEDADDISCVAYEGV